VRTALIYVFHHIPKAGGKSCLAAFGEWFELVRDYRSGKPRETPDAYPPKADLDALDETKLLCGHWEFPGYRIFERYPEFLERDDVRIITFLRDPLEIVISTYFYGRRRNATHLDKTLDERVDEVTNFVQRVLGCEAQAWRAHLERYWFVGVTERLQESFDVLADRLDKPRIEVPTENATSRDGLRPSAEAMARFRARCVVDHEIHAYAQRRLDAGGVDWMARSV